MRKSSTWYNASPEDWVVARHREAIIRPLAARSPLTPIVVDETAHTLKLSRSLVYHLVYGELPNLA